MVESVIRDQKRLLPVCARSQGEYGIEDVYVGVPAILGHRGVESIVEIGLNDEELADLRRSAEISRGNVETCNKLIEQ